MSDHFVSRVPWSPESSLKEKANEVGINFDEFITGLKNNKSNAEMAEEFGVSEKVIENLREHFEKTGVDSIVGRD